MKIFNLFYSAKKKGKTFKKNRQAKMEDNLLLSLPSALAMRSSNQFNDQAEYAPITTQNYMDKYRELEKILGDEKRTSDQLKKFYSVLKNDHTR